MLTLSNGTETLDSLRIRANKVIQPSVIRREVTPPYDEWLIPIDISHTVTTYAGSGTGGMNRMVIVEIEKEGE